MLLKTLAQVCEGSLFHCFGTEEILGISSLSTDVKKGYLFVAIKGLSIDGHGFINDAFARGSVACVVEDPKFLRGKPGFVVQNSKKALSKIASHFYGNPGKDLDVIGVTGTNGKTTIVWILSHILKALGRMPLRIGTLGTFSDGIINDPGNLTTPDPIYIHSVLSRAKNQGVNTIVMEVSSHSLSQSRVDDIDFNVGVFTNLTRDHLDYHRTMDEYFRAKSRLFDLIKQSQKNPVGGVINIDDPWGNSLFEGIDKSFSILTYGFNLNASIVISDFETSINGSSFNLSFQGQRFNVKTCLIGKFNAENIAASFAASILFGLTPEDIIATINSVTDIPGRLQRVTNNGIHVFVDYCHTPDSLEKALSTLKPLTKGRLWALFGCGGDRDKGKRPQMASVARKLADRVVVTSDNPRTEDPEEIIKDILEGAPKADIVEPDRVKAIHMTISEARSGDVVLLAGKGHEDYQIIGKEKRYLSDLEEARRALFALK